MSVPPSKNYQSNIVSVPLFSLREPAEGTRGAHFEIDWANMGGPNNSVYIDATAQTTIKITQCIALNVDNSQCGVDIRFTFPDTQSTLVIPAYSGPVIVPVFTGTPKVYVTALNQFPAGTNIQDVTSFDMLNFLPAPVAVPRSQIQSALAPGAVSTAAGGTTNILSSAQSGTLEGLNIIATTTAAVNIGIAIEDGLGNVLWQTGLQAAGAVNEVLCELTDLQARFGNGLNVVISGTTFGAGSVYVNAYYRSP